MSEPLWHWDELVSAVAGISDAGPAGVPTHISGVSIDSRSVQREDLFVALRDQRDGHEFVTGAFAAGASAALVASHYQRQPGDGALIRVPDPLKGLEAAGRAARARSGARILAVTGSVGKTGSKEALRHCLELLGKTHASQKSYNNHWGVPLTLARMPRDAAYGVFEIGMNHPGEITPLVKMVRPHVALITTVQPVHLGQFSSVERIAEAKAEIFDGLETGGTAVLNRDNEFYDLLKKRAIAKGVRVLPFGAHVEAVALLVEAQYGPERSDVRALIEGIPLRYQIGQAGAHMVANSLGVLAAIKTLGGDITVCVPALAQMRAPEGRGARKVYPSHGKSSAQAEAEASIQSPAQAQSPITVIDESYNANPASMRAAIGVLGRQRRDAPGSRRIAVLGDMLELGTDSAALHQQLMPVLSEAGVELVFACGELMRAMFDSLPADQKGAWAEDAAALCPLVLGAIKGGDVIMVKGSLGSKMRPIVDALDKELGACST